MLEPREIQCRECGVVFSFDQGQCDFFNTKGFENYPSTCTACKLAIKNGSTQATKKMYPATCSQCGKDTTVPFLPAEGRPVYCRDCYLQINGK
jgi:CxxC-x17-CxxC domain-containing protein